MSVYSTFRILIKERDFRETQRVCKLTDAELELELSAAEKEIADLASPASGS